VALKSHFRYSVLTDLYTRCDVAGLIARSIAVGGSLESLDAYLAQLAAVTPEDVARVTREYLTPQRRFVVTLSHAEGGAQ
jgi:predicted Zn-dependent peptidase